MRRPNADSFGIGRMDSKSHSVQPTGSPASDDEIVVKLLTFPQLIINAQLLLALNVFASAATLDSPMCRSPCQCTELVCRDKIGLKNVVAERPGSLYRFTFAPLIPSMSTSDLKTAKLQRMHTFSQFAQPIQCRTVQDTCIQHASAFIGLNSPGSAERSLVDLRL